MGLRIDWNLDDSQQSGGAKDLAPDLCAVQTSVSPQHPVELPWLAPSEWLTLAYCFLSVKSRKASLLKISPFIHFH